MCFFLNCVLTLSPVFPTVLESSEICNFIQVMVHFIWLMSLIERVRKEVIHHLICKKPLLAEITYRAN